MRLHLELVDFYPKQLDMHMDGRHINLHAVRCQGETSRLKTTTLEIECLEYSKLRNDMLSSICFTVYNSVMRVVDNTAILMALNLTDKAIPYMESPRMQLDTLHRIQRIAHKIARITRSA